MTTSRLELSRPLAVAAMLRKGTLSEAEVLQRPVLLTAETFALTTANGQWCFLDCLRLLARITGPLVVVLPPGTGAFESTVRELTESVHSLGSVSLHTVDTAGDYARYCAILNVGATVRAEMPWTTVNSNGWIARVTSGAEPLPPDMDQDNPIAALMAASLGVTEVFKRTYDIPASVGPLLGLTEFSLFDLTDTPNCAGPALHRAASLPDTVIVGAGAIGNGLVLLLSQIGWKGRVHLIDNQNYDKENKGTCVLLDKQDWIELPKAEQLAEWLNSRSDFQVTYETANIEQARSSATTSSLAVDLVLNGLDDVQARHDAQLLWPSVTVDGGINAVGAAAVTHRLDKPRAACLRCAFKLPTVDSNALQREATGLDNESLQDQSQPLSEGDIERADQSRRPWLREMRAQGKTRCAVVSEAIARRLGTSLESGFRPSVPFVATAAAALVIAQAAKSIFHPNAPFTHHFQIESLFRGPASSVATFQAASRSCLCVTGRAHIDTVFNQRRAKRESIGV